MMINIRHLSHIKQRHLQPVIVNVCRTMAIRLFDGKKHANLYAIYRPSHTENIYKHILQFYESGKEKGCDYNLAVDIGCGNGQSTRPLCKYFKSVIGTDVSAAQIEAAKTDLTNLTFKVGPGEELGFLNNDSTDLITLSSALHWLDFDKFFSEVKRVLKSGGVIAAYSYGNCVLDKKEAHDIVQEFYSGFLAPYWAKRRQYVDEHYKSITFPFEDVTRKESDDIAIVRDMPVDGFIGYLSTWSAWQTCLKENPECQRLDEIQQRFESLYGDRTMKVVWPVFLILGRKAT